MRGGLGDTLISTGALVILLVAIVSMDTRVRDHVMRLVPGGGAASSEITSVARQASDTASAVMGAARDQSIEQAPLVIFVTVATILVLFMVRT